MADTITPATLTVKGGSDDGHEIPIHFNPASLQYTVSNTMESASGNRKKQFVSQTSAKLTMDLVYDTTDTGADVRDDTERVARLMRPPEETTGTDRVPAVVEFRWGNYKFTGMVEQFRETIDFF